MSMSVHAYTVLGYRVLKSSVAKPAEKVWGCTHALPGSKKAKFCPECAAPLYVTDKDAQRWLEDLMNALENIEEPVGVVEGEYLDHGQLMFVGYVGTASDGGSYDEFPLPIADIATSQAELNAILTQVGFPKISEVGTFGLWTVSLAY